MFTEADIYDALESGVTTFKEFRYRLCPAPERANGPLGWRKLDGLLQKMRRRGQIIYHRKNGWAVVGGREDA
jgi:hypothetical protein